MLFYRLMCLWMPEYHARCLARFPDTMMFLVLLFLSLCALYYYSPFQRTYPLDQLLNDATRWLDKVFLE